MRKSHGFLVLLSASPTRPLLRACALALAGASMACSAVGREEFEALRRAQADTQARVEKLERTQARAPAPARPQGPDASKTYAIPVGNAPVRGPADAYVTIVEISDFQCPYCARAAGTLKEIEALYKGDVRIVFKHNPLPFHQRALPAALATSCAHAQNKFWPMADALFADQSHLSDGDLAQAAADAGLNLAQYKTCLKDEKIKARIDEDQALAVKFGARGTPAFFINGRFLSGAQPLDAFRKLIDEELARAKASKVAQAAYYAQVVEQKGEQAL